MEESASAWGPIEHRALIFCIAMIAVGILGMIVKVYLPLLDQTLPVDLAQKLLVFSLGIALAFAFARRSRRPQSLTNSLKSLNQDSSLAD